MKCVCFLVMLVMECVCFIRDVGGDDVDDNDEVC